MEATQELSSAPEVQLQQTYWVTEDSKAKLMLAGATCLDTVIQSEHYYDTASDELAMAELWLSRRNQQWRLIVESQKQTARGNIVKSVPKMCKPPDQNRRDNATSAKAIVSKGLDEKSPESEFLKNQNNHQHDFNECRGHMKVSSTYTELVRESDIITYLADFLNIDLKTEEGNMPMEDFLQRAGIQHYASNHTANQTTYLLSNRYTIIIQRDEYSFKESATVLLDVDVLNICKGFEELQELGNYLEFIQREQTPYSISNQTI